MAHRPNLAHEDIKKIIIFEKFVDVVDYHIPKQSIYSRCLALQLLCDDLCGPWKKKFGDP